MIQRIRIFKHNYLDIKGNPNIFIIEKIKVAPKIEKNDQLSLIRKRVRSQENSSILNKVLKSKLKTESKVNYIMLTINQREELYERLLLIKEKWLSVTNESRRQLITKTFNHEFISFMTVIVPQSITDLTRNNAVSLKPEWKELLKIYGHLIFGEVEHFLKSIGVYKEIDLIQENNKIERTNKEVNNFTDKINNNSNINNENNLNNDQKLSQKQEDSKCSDSSADSSSSASLMDIMNNQLDDGYTSPLELKPNFVGKLNESLLDEIIKPKIQPQSVISSKQYS